MSNCYNCFNSFNSLFIARLNVGVLLDEKNSKDLIFFQILITHPIFDTSTFEIKLCSICSFVTFGDPPSPCALHYVEKKKTRSLPIPRKIQMKKAISTCVIVTSLKILRAATLGPQGDDTQSGD